MRTSMKSRIIVCFLSFFVGIHADFQCVCNFNVELTVFTSMNASASQLGSMYEFDCKAAVNVTTDQGWAAVAFQHTLAYVQLNGDVQQKVCPGDPPVDDALTSSTAAVVSTVATTAGSTEGTTAPSTTTVPTTPGSTEGTIAPDTTTLPTTTLPTTTTTVMMTSTAPRKTSEGTKSTPMSTTTLMSTTMLQSSTDRTPHSTAAFVTTTKQSTAACPSATSHYKTMTTVYKQSCYEIVDHHETWNDAEAHCKRRGGHLMHIGDAQEQEFITKYLLANYNHEVWIGLGDHRHEERFEWTSGTPLRYTHWDPSRKNSLIHGFEDCVVLQPSDQGYWDDRQCSGIIATKHSYICQYTGGHAGVIIG